MTCPRCGKEQKPGVLHGEVRCLNGSFGNPCGEFIGKIKKARREPNVGNAFEHDLRLACDYYGRQGFERAHVRKLLTSSVGDRAQGGPEFRYTKHGFPDFEGFLVPSGAFCRFEAKATKHEALRLSEITDSQRKRLDQAARTESAVVGLVVRLLAGTSKQQAWWVDWRRVPAEGSLNADWLDQQGRRLPALPVSRGTAVMWLDDAAAARRAG